MHPWVRQILDDSMRLRANSSRFDELLRPYLDVDAWARLTHGGLLSPSGVHRSQENLFWNLDLKNPDEISDCMLYAHFSSPGHPFK